MRPGARNGCGVLNWIDRFFQPAKWQIFFKYSVIPTMQSGYLLRLKARRAHRTRRGQIGFGLIAGGLLSLFGAFRMFYAADASQGANITLMIAGGMFLAAGLLRPSWLRPIKFALGAVASWIGRRVFSVLLTVAYFCVITPIGLARRVGRGRAPFYFGKGTPEGWTPKIIDDGPPANEGDN
jgi:hypothetical protein